MIDVVVPFLLLAALGGFVVLAVADVLRRRGHIRTRLVPATVYLLVLVAAAAWVLKH